jgi:hypothetical protein
MEPVAAAVPYRSAPQPDAAALIEIVERAMHASVAECLFFRELRVGTGRRSRPCYETDVGSFQNRRGRFNNG